MCEFALLSWIAVGQPIHSHLDAGAACAILQVIDPVAIDIGHLYAHAYSVVYGIQVATPARRSACPGWSRQLEVSV